MCEWNVVIGDVVEEVNLVAMQGQPCSNRMDWRVTPAFVEKATILVKAVEEVKIGL